MEEELFIALPRIDWNDWLREIIRNEMEKMVFSTCYICGEEFDCEYNLNKHVGIVHI